MEKRYESDMTPKEKRELERKKLASMTLGQKIGYLWEYYKIWLLILAVVIMFISMFVTMYQNSQKINLMGMAVANSTTLSDTSGVTEDLIEMLGTGDEHETVTVDTSYYFNEDIANTDPNIIMKFSTMVAAQSIDVLISSVHVMDYYKDQEMFLMPSEYLSEEQIAALGDRVSEYGVRIDGSSLLEKWDLVAYEPVYFTVIANSPNVENAVKLLEKLVEE